MGHPVAPYSRFVPPPNPATPGTSSHDLGVNGKYSGGANCHNIGEKNKKNQILLHNSLKKYTKKPKIKMTVLSLVSVLTDMTNCHIQTYSLFFS